MAFRPCIDIHAGAVKQIIGSSLNDRQNITSSSSTSNTTTTTSETPDTNFISSHTAGYYANLYKQANLTGGHVICLDQTAASKAAALDALSSYPHGLQIGGGITATTAPFWIASGASHVIVTSHVFHDGKIDFDALENLVAAVGTSQLVLDLSCRLNPAKNDGLYYIVTDRWQTFTSVAISQSLLTSLAGYCAEFLVHAVDVEGKQNGIQSDLVELLGQWSPIPVTYAGGASSLQDLSRVQMLGHNKVHLSIGSALDIFGGSIPFTHVVAWHTMNTQNTLVA